MATSFFQQIAAVTCHGYANIIKLMLQYSSLASRVITLLVIKAIINGY